MAPAFKQRIDWIALTVFIKHKPSRAEIKVQRLVESWPSETSWVGSYDVGGKVLAIEKGSISRLVNGGEYKMKI